ncbi:MAG: helix-turn-helix transcriptional regulator [Spirochaetes bacterium]|nr:helix-turn-helix transcriptional regulator [Spirochaetota bacterium]
MSVIRVSAANLRRIQTANYSYFPEPYPHPDRVMDAHDIVYIVAGGWEICEESETFLLTPGDAVFLTAGRHHFGTGGCLPGTRTMWLHVYPEKDDRYFDRKPGGNVAGDSLLIPPVIRTGKNLRIHSLFEGIIHNFWSSAEINRIRARALVTELFIELASCAGASAIPAENAVDYVINLIEKNPSKVYAIDTLATMAGVNRRTLTAHFRKRTKRSIRQFQIELKVRMAASVFDNAPDTPVRVVAGMFGFFDEFHFSRTFKQVTGVAPVHYKARR